MTDRTITYAKATLEALVEEMDRDTSVFLMGEDIAKQGGVFGQFAGLSDRFGRTRVRDTPISEAAIVGSAVGAALTGSRPVVDIHFADFVTCAMDELVNQAAKMRYMFGGQVSLPLVIRAPEGAINSAGPQHSQSLEAWFCHTPGWRVVSPSNAADAKGLLKSAIRSNDPVMYLEHKALYARKGQVPEGDVLVPIGEARVVQTGHDITIVSWSLSVERCLQAAEQLASDGISADVIDMRTLAPLDIPTIIASARRTRRVLVVHEGVMTGGLGAEIAARVNDELFGHLLAPVRRVANPDVPVAFAPSLERAIIPQADRVVAAVKGLLA